MKIGSETGIQKSVNRAVSDANNAFRLSSASMAGRTVFNGRTTVQQPLTDPSTSDCRAHESQAD